MLVVQYTWIVSCTDQMCFFNPVSFRGRCASCFARQALLFLSGPSFRWFLSLSTGSFPRSCLVRLCFRFGAAVLVLHAVGLEINQISISISTMVLCSSTLPVSRSELLVASDLLGFRLLRSIGTSTEYRRSTAAVVPSYLVSKLGAALVQFAQWRSIRNRLDTRSCC